MNCAYHSQNVAVVSCNGCGRPLCPACDHRVKGFPFCQDCIVQGVEFLRQHNNQASYVPLVKKHTSPFIATVLSLLCPGLGGAYNGQMVKALVHFAVFVGLFQMAVLTGGTPIFVLGFLGMWLFAALDSWRTAQLIRSGVTTDGAEDILVKRFSGNPKLWGIVLAVLGFSFLLQNVLGFRWLMRGVLPVGLIGLGAYLIYKYVIRPRGESAKWNGYEQEPGQVTALSEPVFHRPDFEAGNDFADRTRSGSWRSR